jgi:signal transduction histidine kinase
MDSSANVKVLIINGGAHKDAKNLAGHLGKVPQLAVDCTIIDGMPMATAALLNKTADVIFIDASLIESDNETLTTLREMAPDCSIVAMTKNGDDQTALELLRAGADDCFVKEGFSRAGLMIALHRACGSATLRRERSMAKAFRKAGRVDAIEEKLLIKEELLESRKLEAIGQLAGGVAHDFNNILGAISGYAELIQKRFGADNPKIEKYTATILAAARRAAELTAQLLTFARKGSFRMERCDTHQLLNSTIQLLRHSFDKTIKIEKDLRAVRTEILGDATQLQTALLNIAMNARDAMPSGGSLSISTDNVMFDESYKKQFPSIVCGEYVVVEMIDTGVGMNDYVRTRLFEPFFTTKDTGKGSGLHLASVHGTIKAHNGFCAVTSEPGSGSSFKIHIPLAAAPKPMVPALPVDASEKSGARILVVDDEELMRSIYWEMLGNLGFSVTICGGGQEAVEIYEKEFGAIDLVIIDMIMGEMNGIDSFRELKKINPKLRAILASGYDLAEKEQEIIAEGFAGLIKKPFISDTLLKAVSEALRNKAS